MRGFRHTLFLLLQLGIVLSAAIAFALDRSAWPAILICAGGSIVATLLCDRIARQYLRHTLGHLRRLTDQVARGRPLPPLDAQPGDDFYKLVAAINQVSTRLAEVTAEEQRLNDQLRRSEKLAVLGELAANVAHEVNNPLDGIQHCVRILRRSLNDPQRAGQMLDLIDGGLARIDLIVRRLLTLARQHVIRPQKADLCEVVESTLRLTAKDFERVGVRVRREFDSRPAAASVDPPLLEQAFLNLLTNAADAMPAGGEIVVRVRRDADAEADWWRIDFSDAGGGISAEHLPHIFEPFFTTKGGQKGTGLGLSIAARIVDAHRGSIGVTPRETGGTTFTIRIPAGEAASPRAAAHDGGRALIGPADPGGAQHGRAERGPGEPGA